MAEGYDVWLGNWRGSIDLPECDYTLDDVARYDHPALIATVLRETGALDAQGDRALPGLDVLRPGRRRRARARGDRRRLQRGVLPRRRPDPVQAPDAARRAGPRVRLQGLRPAVDAAPDRPARATAGHWRARHRRECHEPVCQMANFTYGVGGNILWDHANLDPPTHRWIAREFGWVPITFFQQMSRCATAGHLVAASGYDEIPEDVVASAPRNRPRWTFLAGSANRCFLAAQPGARVRVAGRPGARPARDGGPSGLHAPRRLLRSQRRTRRLRAHRRRDCDGTSNPQGS